MRDLMLTSKNEAEMQFIQYERIGIVNYSLLLI